MKVFKPFKRIKKQSGQSLVEFALVTPILLVFLLGIVEFGWLLNARINLTSAAREGARTAVVSSENRSTKAFNAAKEAVKGVSGITLINDSSHYKYTEVEDSTNNIRNAVVEIKGNVKPMIGMFVGDPFEMEVKTTMRIE